MSNNKYIKTGVWNEDASIKNYIRNNKVRGESHKLDMKFTGKLVVESR